MSEVWYVVAMLLWANLGVAVFFGIGSRPPIKRWAAGGSYWRTIPIVGALQVFAMVWVGLGLWAGDALGLWTMT